MTRGESPLLLEASIEWRRCRLGEGGKTNAGLRQAASLPRVEPEGGALREETEARRRVGGMDGRFEAGRQSAKLPLLVQRGVGFVKVDSPLLATKNLISCDKQAEIGLFFGKSVNKHGNSFVPLLTKVTCRWQIERHSPIPCRRPNLCGEQSPEKLAAAIRLCDHDSPKFIVATV